MMTSVVSQNYSAAMSRSFSDQHVGVPSFKARAKDWSKRRESETFLFFFFLGWEPFLCATLGQMRENCFQKLVKAGSMKCRTYFSLTLPFPILLNWLQQRIPVHVTPLVVVKASQFPTPFLAWVYVRWALEFSLHICSQKMRVRH